jgi:hypothetical protein
MAGDEFRGLGEIEASLGLKHARHGEADGHESRLRVGGEREIGLRALKHQRRELLAERLVHFGEDGARRRESLGQRLAHADRLRPLPRKHESHGHLRSLRQNQARGE